MSSLPLSDDKNRIYTFREKKNTQLDNSHPRTLQMDTDLNEEDMNFL